MEEGTVSDVADVMLENGVLVRGTVNGGDDTVTEDMLTEAVPAEGKGEDK